MSSGSAPEAASSAAVALPERPAARQRKVNEQRPPRLQTLLWQRLVLAAMRGATARLQRMPRPAALRFGRRLGLLAYRAAGRQRQRALSNLRLAFGSEMDASAREELVRDVFRHFGMSLIDFLRAPALEPESLDALVSCEGWEHVEAALRQTAAGGGSSSGVLLVTAHLGNWELLGRWLAQVKKVPLTVVAREPKQPAFAAYIRKMREGAGFRVLSKGESARDLLKALRRGGEAILLLPDQNSGDLFVPFFGVPAGTVAGPASLALKTGLPLVPIYFLQQKDGSYRVVCHPPLCTSSTGDNAADVARITGQINRALENVIREHPAQWLWLHNRWKSAFEEENRQAAWGGDEQAYRDALARREGRESGSGG